MRFRAVLSEALKAAGPNGEAAALAEIEATGAPRHRTLARLLLAHERREWEPLLTLTRTADLAIDITKPRELRALGELGRNEEMVRTYERSRGSIPFHARDECQLFVLAFTGHTEGVERLLRGRLSAADDDSKTYWRAVARLQSGLKDEPAYAMLRSLAETGAKPGTRRSAAQQMRRVENDADRPAPPLSQEVQRILVAIARRPLRRVRDRQEQRERRRRRRRILLWLILLCLIWGVIEAHWTFSHVARVP
jgi:hypothetical protein